MDGLNTLLEVRPRRVGGVTVVAQMGELLRTRDLAPRVLALPNVAAWRPRRNGEASAGAVAVRR